MANAVIGKLKSIGAPVGIVLGGVIAIKGYLQEGIEWWSWGLASYEWIAVGTFVFATAVLVYLHQKRTEINDKLADLADEIKHAVSVTDVRTLHRVRASANTVTMLAKIRPVALIPLCHRFRLLQSESVPSRPDAEYGAFFQSAPIPFEYKRNRWHGSTRCHQPPSFSKYISGDESTWHLTFGANTVHISKAVRDCRSALIGWAAELKSVPTAADWGRARSQIHSAARGAVTSFNGSFYGSYGDANRMAFGAHAIDLPDFTKSLGKLLGIVELSLVSHAPVRTNARRESVPSDLATCKLCGQFVRVSRLAKHLSDRCAKRPGQQSGH